VLPLLFYMCVAVIPLTPLTASTANPASADLNADGKVDLDDFARFQECLTSPGTTIFKPGCEAADLDNDGDVDIHDLDAFVKQVGQAVPLQRVHPVPPSDPVALTSTDSPAATAPHSSLITSSVLSTQHSALITSSAPSTAPATTGAIPPRSAGALIGSAFVAEVLDATLDQREARVREEMISGNIPDFLRRFLPLTVRATIDGQPHTMVYEVMPDYLAIGSDADFVRMPMRPQTAQAVADRFECVLPTRKMVNDIYAQATVKLAPSPIDPKTVDMTYVATFYLHHLIIENQRADRPLGLLIGGIKKDVVVTPQLAARPAKVAIYGWHQLNGRPIQPLYLGHTNRWVDYSQCIRLVKRSVILDGKTRPITDVLKDPKLCTLLSDEGMVENPRYPE